MTRRLIHTNFKQTAYPQLHKTEKENKIGPLVNSQLSFVRVKFKLNHPVDKVNGISNKPKSQSDEWSMRSS